MAELHPRTRTPICPACGCALVRLGVTPDSAAMLIHAGKELRFCCDGCAAVFSDNPDELLAEISEVVVCPVCLAEKHISHTVELQHEGASVRLCRCPGCAGTFRNDPDRLLERLAF